MLSKYIKKLANNKEIYLKVKVLPQAGRTLFLEEMADETLKIAVGATPEKGRANQELLRFLAREFFVSKNQVKIISGLAERTKLIKIQS